MSNDRNLEQRRNFLGLAAMAGIATALPAGAVAAADTPNYGSVEQANKVLVEQFCAAWGTLDMERILSLISEDFIYQPYDNAPLTHGVAEFRAYIQPFLDSSREIRFEILRTSVIGPVVLNERIDHILAKPGGKDMTFPIAGMFHIVNNRIRIWYDFFMPGYQMAAPAAG